MCTQISLWAEYLKKELTNNYKKGHERSVHRCGCKQISMTMKKAYTNVGASK